MKITYTLFYILAIISMQGCNERPAEPSPEQDNNESTEIILDEEEKMVFEELRIKDSLIFELGFNQCDTSQLKLLTSSDFEFYHDVSGITDSQEAFLESIVGLCKMDYKATRVLEPNSLSVQLMKNGRDIYGAIQSGKHLFYGEVENKPKYLTSTADFTHLWILEDDDWKLKRVLSYNHQDQAVTSDEMMIGN